ncbi:MAG: peptide chain release factor N(5)-glutamine methyltransferase [Lentisphaeria bacterium]|nr:peptide chain release factor N(5)-glutamine methyltransferase [Lentisphaeria bacterium]
MNIAELRKQGLELLSRSGFDAPEHECDYLLSGALKLPLLTLHLDPQREITPQEAERIVGFFKRRAAREPAQYILGTAPFRDLELEVTPAVLIPRPETEELVDLALERAPRNGSVLDMGTGSGAIPLALKSERPDLHITAVDLSPDALEAAQRNSQKLKLAVDFRHSDLWSALEGRIFDLVTANLPYVSEDEYKECSQEIFFEPVMALTAPDNGLALMKKMIADLSLHLSPGGWAIFELSHHQNPVICQFGRALGFAAECKYDMAGKARFVLLQKV